MDSKTMQFYYDDETVQYTESSIAVDKRLIWKSDKQSV